MFAVANASDIIGAEILNIVDLEVVETVTHESSGDVTDIHFYEIKTIQGTATVELRVEHNGYYGGWLADVKLVTEIPHDALVPE